MLKSTLTAVFAPLLGMLTMGSGGFLSSLPCLPRRPGPSPASAAAFSFSLAHG